MTTFHFQVLLYLIFFFQEGLYHNICHLLVYPQWPQWSGLGEAEAVILGLHPDISNGWQGLKYLAYLSPLS